MKTMKIIIAPDSFKESLSALDVATEIEAGFRTVFPDADYVKLPIADGGEGTVAALVAATGGKMHSGLVRGPLGDTVEALYGISGDKQTAFIEMAAASGLELVSLAQRNPMKTSSFGTGELLLHALEQGIRHFIIGIGGSATNDGGVGMLQALGVSFLDDQDREIGLGAQSLMTLSRIDTSGLDQRLQQSRIQIACDVDNPLTGEKGASVIFGPQKGATPEMVATLDHYLKNYASLVRRDLQRDVETVPGAGAAGGMGAAFLAFTNAELRPGIHIVMETVKLDQHLAGATLVVTGEGKIDGQTMHGKAPIGVARTAQKAGIPVIAFAGSLGEGVERVREQGISACFSIVSRPCSLETALKEAKQNVRLTATNVAELIALGQDIAVSTTEAEDLE
jgi:glycerate kinase